MRLTRPTLAIAAALGLSLLAACGSSGPTPGATGAATDGGTAAVSTPLPGAVGIEAVTATGPVDFTTAPKVKFTKKPVSTSAVTSEVLVKGSGQESTAKDTVMLRAQIFNGTTGKLLDNGYDKGRTAEGFRLGRTDLIKGFAKGLTGVQQGARVAFTIPPSEGFGSAGNANLGIGPTDTIVVVADIKDVHAGLTEVTGTQQPSPAGLPTVTFPDGPTKAPTVTIPKSAAPTKTEQATLIEGTGPVVRKGETITAQYHGVLWKDGKVFDSSWERGALADFAIGVGQVIPGWDKTLVGKKVGSRVLLVIPPADGYGAKGMGDTISGTDTLVFVVDILDAY
ncbi:MAG: FKBP-type peptidyl-prolyl cis-trans isomerase [Intrasporangium sp.]|uniref:FKBP-type peptidyl-prolyl cis-trans isomerase n=1 Tax=Intrasporangium sp. TaxID=1925024 RepID=UPI0026497258|nr:FKBP-type peptidyl-prolyl cis-trans isomerase [Intrasporangium sp.]MDN5794690.1 FKBP-type peptidyl-prolyl cis-trans isomerase [Intrasporangium sp.]